MKPYLEDPDLTLYNGDALEVLQSLPSGAVHMCVTSPPFYGLRDYGTGSWEGGHPDCDHAPRKLSDGCLGCGCDLTEYADDCPNCAARKRMRLHRDIPLNKTYGEGPPPTSADWRAGASWQNHTGSVEYVCGKCGARRVDQQIGLEETPEQWVAKLVAVFREVRRVLRVDGSCWVEVGDSYAGGNKGGTYNPETWKPPAYGDRTSAGARVTSWTDRQQRTQIDTAAAAGCKPKDLIGAPWMLAFALRADGWYLRSDIIWSRPNPMPESVTDRPTKSHSYVFLLSKSARYFFDQEAVREKASENTHQRFAVARETPKGREGHNGWDETTNAVLSARNVRSVWQIATQPYPEAHFATYPEELVRRCILAGTSERGCCPECGAPWTRKVETSYLDGGAGGPASRHLGDGKRDPASGGYAYEQRKTRVDTTTGWVPSCGCPESDVLIAPVPDPVPCTVLDPFFGSGTTGLVARKHGRQTIGIELSESYCGLAGRRLQQLSLLAGEQQ